MKTVSVESKGLTWKLTVISGVFIPKKLVRMMGAA
jgi:hypothetical protein